MSSAPFLGSQPAPILILNGDGLWVSATLLRAVTEAQARKADTDWQTFSRLSKRRARLRHISVADVSEHKHWNWERLWQKKDLARRFWAIEAANQWQGVLVVKTDRTCRLPSQQGKRLIYIDYLATAPWNYRRLLERLKEKPRFQRIGPFLLRAAIVLSRSSRRYGRIGLHSLPQSEVFYRNKCGMTDLGRDRAYLNLHYFEMTPEQADKFMSEA